MPGPGWWWFAFVALTPWAVATERAESKRARFLVDYLWGVVFFSIAVFWLARITLLAFLPVIVLAPFFIVAAGFVYRSLRRRLPAAIALPMAWLAGEVLREIPPFYYPWDLLGYAAAGWLDLAGIASIGGVWLLTFMFAFVNGAAADAIRYQSVRLKGGMLMIAAAAIFVCALAGGQWRRVPKSPPEGPLFACVQPNVPQELKENPGAATEYARMIVEGIGAAARVEADIVVLPETMLPNPVIRGLPPDTPFSKSLKASDFTIIERQDLLVFREYLGSKPWLLTGALVYDTAPRDAQEPPRPKNSALLYDNNNREVGRYDKLYLVPGGEMIPMIPEGILARAIRDALNPYTYGMVPDLVPGNESGIFKFKNAGGEIIQFGVSICYDNIFTIPFRQPAERGASFHVVLSNEGWFPDSYEMGAMLGFSAIRAIETGRSILRATNTGVSCVIDADGTLRSVFEKNGRRSEIAGVFVTRPPMYSHRTVYVTVGDWPAYLLAALAGFLAIVFVAIGRLSKKPG